MNKESIIYYFAGLLVAIVFVLIIGKKMGRNLKGQPDERQLLIRGVAYKYAFFATMLSIIVFSILHDITDLLPVTETVGAFWCCCIGTGVYACYSIIHDAYFGLRDKKSRFLIFTLLVIAANALALVNNIQRGAFLENGVLVTSGMNIGVIILFSVILISILTRQAIEKEEET